MPALSLTTAWGTLTLSNLTLELLGYPILPFMTHFPVILLVYQAIVRYAYDLSL